MQTLIRIREIEDRAAVLRLSLKQLCDLAGVHASGPYRWRLSDANPRVATYEATCAALEVVLAAEEDRVRSQLRVPAGRDVSTDERTTT